VTGGDGGGHLREVDIGVGDGAADRRDALADGDDAHGGVILGFCHALVAPGAPAAQGGHRRRNAMPDILHETRGRIAWTVLNRPQARNAMTFEMYEGLFEQAQRVGEDEAIRAWVITGAGGKAFAAGTDISQFTHFRTGQDALDYEQRIDRVLSAIEDCPKPVIAAIAGACTGGGLGIAGVCDLRIASANARFGAPIARTLGNTLSTMNISRFARLIGPARLKDLIFRARLIDGGGGEGRGPRQRGGGDAGGAGGAGDGVGRGGRLDGAAHADRHQGRAEAPAAGGGADPWRRPGDHVLRQRRFP
jgi:hypothetical protein